MTSQHPEEIAANIERAEQSVGAARELASGGYCDFAASRAYYAAFYAATAVLLSEGLELNKHSAVIASIHQRFVKTGKLDKEHGKTLNWLFELRGGRFSESDQVPDWTDKREVKSGSALRAARPPQGEVEVHSSVGTSEEYWQHGCIPHRLRDRESCREVKIGSHSEGPRKHRQRAHLAAG